MGDPLWYYGDFSRPDHWGHWTFFSQPPGTDTLEKTPYTGVGGVFRVRPDGSGFQIVARGLRNSCGLVFDRDWNLFTNDNDHEGMPRDYVPGKLNHITPHSYFSWPRGWMLSKTPDRADMLETMFEGMGRAVPVGQSYYDDPFLPEKYRNNLLLARWGIRAVTRYPLEHNGATFKTDEFQLLTGRNQARPVGVTVGRGGRIFVTISYMQHNEGSPIYKSDFAMLTRADDAATHPFGAYDAVTAAADKLYRELSHSSWWRRSRAHGELLRRGGKDLGQAVTRLQTIDSDDPARPHLIWLTAAAVGNPTSGVDRKTAADAVFGVLNSNQRQKATDRLQALRACTEFLSNDERFRGAAERALEDHDSQVRHAGVLAFFKIPGPLPMQMLDGPARSDDTYLRQAATLLMAERLDANALDFQSSSMDAKHRLAGVLAAGFRLTLPPATEPIADHLPLQPWRSEDVYLLEYADEKVDLRDFGRIGLFTVAEHWQAGERTAEEALFELLRDRLDDENERIRLQAAHFLHLLNDARTEPLIAKVRTESEQARLERAPISQIRQAWAVGPFSDAGEKFEIVHPPEQGAVDPSARYQHAGKELAWKKISASPRLFDFGKEFGTAAESSYYAYCRLESSHRQQMMLLVGSDDGVKVWNNGQVVWTNDVSRSALPFQDVVFIELQPGSNDLLVRVQNDAGECALYLHYRSLEPVAVSLPDPVGVAGLADRLKQAAATTGRDTIPAEFLQIDWQQAVREGDAERGRKLFSADGIGCAKCHAIKADADVQGGPSLTDAGKRFTLPHLVESILLPSRQVSPVFRSTLIVTKQGRSFSGLVVNETGEKVELLLPDAKRETILKSEIEERKLQDISPMPQGVVKTPDELRDLLAYLLNNE
jgi:putative heme-binding domain-containing protein